MKKLLNKNKFSLPILFILIVVASLSCERPWVEPWPPDAARQPSDVWANYNLSRGFIERVFSTNIISAGIMDVEGSGMMASASDEAEHSNQQGVVQRFTNGVWGPTNIPTMSYGNVYMADQPRSPWDNSFIGIRRINIFLENIDKSVIIDDVTIPSRRWEKTWYLGQSYFLRAYLQFDLLMRYGAFPISLKSQTLDEDLFQPRNTLKECFDQIIEDCDSAILKLPYIYDDNNWYRPSKTAAQTLKAKAQLYYASPLFQGDPATQPYGIAKNTVGEVARWEEAAATAREAIMENTLHDLMPVTKYTRPLSDAGSYNSQLNLIIAPNQIESIWSSNRSTTNSLNNEIYNLPDNVEGCYGYTNPTQNLVDAFEVVPLEAGTVPQKPITSPTPAAVPFNWSNPVHALNPYANRDPRFYSSINYNGVLWGTSSSYRYYIDTYEPSNIGGVDYPGGVHRDTKRPNSTKTGYYFRKYLSEGVHKYVSGYYTTPTRFKNMYRFSELILIYAEAMNEAYGPYVANPSGPLRNISGTAASSAREAVNLIRARVAMPPIALGLSQDSMRSVIKHERQVELCFENHRFYDLRRWKEGEILAAPIYGVKVTPTAFVSGRPTTFTYQRVKVEDRVFSDKMYWWPIPFSEIAKYEGKLKQNPGW